MLLTKEIHIIYIYQIKISRKEKLEKVLGKLNNSGKTDNAFSME